MMTKKAAKAAWIAITALAACALGCKLGAATVGPGDGECGSCAYVFSNGGVPCDYTSSSEAYDTLLGCACDKCAMECGDSLCAATASNDTCGKCLAAQCVLEHTGCAEN